uniref:DnaJ heat shock protein family (Hsp40) member C24 n=1 Tax=Equus caballus TaxID=9796 RepID=A0A9L0TQZ8_HORSE
AGGHGQGCRCIWKKVDGLESCWKGNAEDWYHPDRQSADAPAEAVEECVRKFIEIDQAWKILGHEETKKEYDLLRLEDDLRNLGPVDAQVYLEEMTWNEDDHCFSLSCRCGGKYRVSKDEAEEVTLISCDTCSLIVELLPRS